MQSAVALYQEDQKCGEVVFYPDKVQVVLYSHVGNQSPERNLIQEVIVKISVILNWYDIHGVWPNEKFWINFDGLNISLCQSIGNKQDYFYFKQDEMADAMDSFDSYLNS